MTRPKLSNPPDTVAPAEAAGFAVYGRPDCPTGPFASPRANPSSAHEFGAQTNAVGRTRPAEVESDVVDTEERSSRNRMPSRILMRARERTGCGFSRRSRYTQKRGIAPREDGSTRRKSPDGAVGGEGWATVGHRGRRVINPDVGGIEVWRIRARRWRKRPDQAVAPPTVGRTSAFASVVPVPRNALTPFSSPE